MATKNGRGRRVVLYSRHFCTICDNRVLPYDGFEALTEAPKPGKKGGRVLLFSANSARSKDNPDDTGRTGYCWVCRKMVETYRETREVLMLRYLKRDGVTFRFNGAAGSREGQVRALNRRMEARKPAAVMSSARR